MRVSCGAVQLLHLVMVEPMKDQPLQPQRVWREQVRSPPGHLPPMQSHAAGDLFNLQYLTFQWEPVPNPSVEGFRTFNPYRTVLRRSPSVLPALGAWL